MITLNNYYRHNGVIVNSLFTANLMIVVNRTRKESICATASLLRTRTADRGTYILHILSNFAEGIIIKNAENCRRRHLHRR